MPFIAFEGGDGSGKSTQVRALARRLRRRGYPCLVTREPGGTPLGELLRRWLKDSSDVAPLSELFLFNAARAQLVRDIITPSLQGGVTIICDRFTASTVAYQGYGRGIDLELIERVNWSATGGLTPDLNVLLDAPPEVGLARKLGGTPDNFEGAPAAFQQRVREGYQAQAGQSPSRWLVLDGTGPARQLGQEIWAKVQPLL